MASNLNLALIPLHIVWGNKDINLAALRKVMDSVHPATDLVVLPETFSTGFPSGSDPETVRSMAETTSGETMKCIRELAARHNMAIAGSFISEEDGILTNKAFFTEPSGDTVYADKRHLFTMAREHKIFNPGNKRLTARYRGWNISLIICYDIRFPVWCRNSGCGYDLLLVVANWPERRIKAWERLIPARAIENLSYVAAVDCAGIDMNGIVYNGCSQTVDYKGDCISVSDKDSGIVYATLSKEKLESFRNKFPAHLDADSFILS